MLAAGQSATPNIKPGDWAVVNTGSNVAVPIQLASYISDRVSRYPNPLISQWDHALMCTGIAPGGIIMIAEAEGGGAVCRAWHYEDRPHQWSTGIIEMPEAAGAAAWRYTQPGPWGKTGVPYGYLDYWALTMHALNLNVPGLQHFIETSHHMICSQLVDQAAQDAGKHLFSDGRWPGYVKPSDLGLLLARAGDAS